MTSETAVITGNHVNTKQRELFFKRKRCSYDVGSLSCGWLIL